ncbi:MAG: ABC transporter permease [bacterium]|nr:ABC transporter permease [bacterium]
MRAEVMLVKRYIFTLKRRTHVATVTAISLAGLALGVMALVVTLALLEGFQNTIRSDIVNRGAHARVEPASGRRLLQPDVLASVLHDAIPDATVTRCIRGTCLVTSVVDAVPASVIGRSDVKQVTLDRVLAARIAVGAGDRIQVISPRQRLTPMGPLPVRLQVEVAEIVAPVSGNESGVIMLPLKAAQQLLWGSDVVEALELKDKTDPWRLGDHVDTALAGVDQNVNVQSLDELNRPLFLALSLERIVIFAAVGLMLLVAALNLLCNVAMIAAEKRQDLAILGGLGMAPASLRRLFLALGMGIGISGALVGAGLGLSVSWLLDATQALPLPRGVFVVSAVPFRVRPEAVLSVLGIALVLTILASWLPARVVSRREPAEGLRYE